MIEFEHKTETVITVDYDEIDRIINIAFPGTEYACAAAEEWGNDTQHELEIDGDSMYIDKTDIEKMKAGEMPLYSLHSVLNDMYNNGLIPKGNYLIRICW